MRSMFPSLCLALALLVAGPARAEPTLRVGATPTGLPFTFLDTKTNTIQGVMVDLVNAVGKEAGFAVAVEPLQFSTLIPALTASKIDIISAAMFITPQRKEVVAFSAPVYSYGEGLIVPKTDTKDYASFADLKGETVGAQVGTAFVEPLKKSGLFADVKIYDTIPDIIRDVNSGRLKAGFADAPILAYYVKQGVFPGVRLVETLKPTVVASVGLSVRKADSELLAKIDAALAKLKADGTLQKILTKWGLPPSADRP
ncbi:ABC transporter substrate-binding protein [Methylobacterium sp. NEAU K]|uniref:ABC transporter substrate-binding protein n=1 Tax=Methylobacterium sp. NEAU K TaxID=3064946 RepID=UPI002736943E|nr:ABC transporter substrate-binding protein [Methylobacterium sp. NEAU K]MDP4006461.1 ABC transporter substrate-binding protein [Methylobacterium sp. NEAU K]